MSKTKQSLWTKAGGKEFFARMAENAKNDADGNEISQTYATKDAATASTAGLMSSADKSKLDGIAAGAQVNAINSVSTNGTALAITNTNVDIPLADANTDGLLPKEKFPLIPAAAQPGAERIYSFDGDSGTGWQAVVRDYVGDAVLDESGVPLEGEDGSPLYSENSVQLWLSYKGTEFGARRAYEDHTGQNIHDTLADKATLAQVTAAIETALANYGGFVVADSLVDGHPDVADPSERFIYLYKDPQSSAEDPYTEWIYTVDNDWDVIGTTSVDLSPYYTSAEVDSLLATKVDTVAGKGLSANDYTDADKNKLTGIETGAQANVIEGVQVNGTAMSVDRKSVNIPAASGNADGVVNGTDVTRWNSWDYARYDVPLTGVTINGRKYPVVKIGNLLWMAENLDYRWTGLEASYDYGSSTVPRANYYDNESATYGKNGNKYGLLYNRPAAKYLEDNKTELGIPAGWRVPTSTDISALLSVAGTGGAKIKSIDGWNNEEWAGTNETGFNLYPTGRRYGNSFGYVGRMSLLWTCTDSESDYYPTLYIDGNQCMGGSQTPALQYSIRLVKTLR